MGRRGRDRAKQAKAAREIKYRAADPDLTALRTELSALREHSGVEGTHAEDLDDEMDVGSDR